MKPIPLAEIRLDRATQARAEMNMEVVVEYQTALAAGATFPPVEVWQDAEGYWLGDGWHRVTAANLAGLKEIPANVHEGGRREAVLCAVSANANHGLRRTNADKRRAVSLLLKDEEWCKWSNREIARHCGVGHSFVDELRSSLPFVGSDNTERTYTTKHGTTATMQTGNIGKAKAPDSPQLPTEPAPSPKPVTEPETTTEDDDEDEEFPCCLNCKHCFSVRPDGFDVWICRVQERAPDDPHAATDCEDYKNENEPEPKPHVAHSSGNEEWYTPTEYTEAARDVMGSIDLDPASCDVANKFVKAEKFYTAEDNGITLPWHGNIWLNPPYAQPTIALFAEAATRKFEAKEYQQACVLVNNATETTWFQRMLERASAICFPKSRIKYLNRNGEPSGQPLQGQAILYFGPNPQFFADAFSSFGKVLRIK